MRLLAILKAETGIDFLGGWLFICNQCTWGGEKDIQSNTQRKKRGADDVMHGAYYTQIEAFSVDKFDSRARASLRFVSLPFPSCWYMA